MNEPTHVELAAQDPSGRLYNEDLAPAESNDRKWTGYSLFSLWMNDAHNVGNYTFAAGLFIAGLSPIDVTLGILVGSIIIFFGCCMSGYMGHATGTPYPVISRMSWGIWGANVPALVRGIVAIAWYGIQTYLASIALKLLLLRFIPAMMDMTETSVLGLDLVGWISFLLLSAIQLAVVWRGMDAVRHFQGVAGPIIWGVMIVLAVWMLSRAGWNISWTTGGGGVHYSLGQQIYHTLVAVGLTVGTLATLMLNFSDFARYAPDRKSIVRGNLWGLPVNWTAFAVTSVIVSAASVEVYGKAVLDPAELLAKFDNDYIFLFGSAVFVFATIGVNIVANFVSASFDISNINPGRISFKLGGIITAVVSVLVMPWNLFSSPAIIAYFLGTLGALLGPFFGILAVDYFLVRRQVFSIRDLYQPDSSSIYFYDKGINGLAVKAFAPSAVVALAIALVPTFSVLAPFGWFIGAPLAALLYYRIAKDKVKLVPDIDSAPFPVLGSSRS
jgi:NCS1 family nucleobase:cation symporter-1